MTKPRLLWVNASVVGPREKCVAQFTRHFRIEEISTTQLWVSDPGSNWDLVCFDFDYPEMAGLKLIPQIKQRLPSAPILMLTVQNSADLALWALRSRVFDLLVKPVTAREIDRCLQRVLGALKARRSQSVRKSQAISAQLPREARYRPLPSGAPRLQAAIAHVARHYSRHIPEPEAAGLCDMSPSKFCREFKAAFGVTFLEYLSHHRVARARELLGNPSMPVSDVAAAVGFSDPSYFTRVFRRQVGLSPSQYRLSVTHVDHASSAATPASVAGA